MDDLAGLDWNSSATAGNNNKPPNPSPYSLASLAPTPPSLSGRSTPLSRSVQSAGSKPPFAVPSKSGTPANDSFSNLLASRKPIDQYAGLSMQERQRVMLEQKARAQAQQFGGSDAAWDTLGTGVKKQSHVLERLLHAPSVAPKTLSATINRPFATLNTQANTVQTNASRTADEADLLAAFDSDAPVNTSSHFPAASAKDSRSGTPVTETTNDESKHHTASATFESLEDDDPFGLGTVAARPLTTNSSPTGQRPQSERVEDDEDVLGLLGKPVTHKQTPTQIQAAPSIPSDTSSSDSDSDGYPKPSSEPRDRAVANLVDMGFPADKAAHALAQTDYNETAAVGYLLNAAHAESSRKSRVRGQEVQQESRDDRTSDRLPRRGREDSSMPAWMRGGEDWQSDERQDSRSPVRDRNQSSYAQDLGPSLLKGATSLWKAGKKNVQRAVADFNRDSSPASDSSQPKWMRDALAAERDSSPEPTSRQAAEKTDEAMLLEAGGRPDKVVRQERAEVTFRDNEGISARSNGSSVRDYLRPLSPPRSRPSPAPPVLRALTRKFVNNDDEVAGAYTSSARRRAPASTQPRAPSPAAAAQNPPATNSLNGLATPRQSATASLKPSPQSAAPIQPRPKAPPRQLPNVSPAALSTSASHRTAGSEAFKRGDYASAHSSYTSAMSSLASPTHPIVIVILCNRAAASLKTGDPKAAIDDANQALGIIGPGLGSDEAIQIGSDTKPMREFYGKALMRKAEGLENLEKWSDALIVWKLAIQAGIGGGVSMQGRQRCEKATMAKAPTAAAATSVPKKTVPAKPRAPARPSASQQAVSAEAVKKLREANAAAERADDEKFQLSDSVDAKLVEWKGSKSDNLRALLGSLDKVLWAEAGWKKVGMQDLVLPNKVKIVYMKAIAKVHPDKIPQNATTEQRMISGAVFSVLNEAWDKFKKENGL